MKKVITFVVAMTIVFTAAFAVAEVTVNWNTEVTGIEVTELEKEFVKDGYDLAVVVIIDNPEDEIKMEKELIRWTDDEDNNYNETYGCLYDKYGLKIDLQEGIGNIQEYVAVCRTHNAACVVAQMVDHVNEYFPNQDFEMYIWENK